MKHPNITTLSALVALTMTLTACQTSNGFSNLSNSSKQSDAVMQLSQAEQAKAELQEAMSRQLRSSFAFQTDIKLSNAQRREALANATPEQLASVQDKRSYCEDTHDKGYVALLKQAKQEGYDIDNNRYETQRDTLKSDYQSCSKKYDLWYENYYYGDSEEAFLPNYDDKHTAQDVKEAEVKNAYLYQPLDMQVTGTYQPMAGKASMLPSVQFESRNLLVRISQPIYIDVKNGALYLWAENFALPMSELVDERLGAKWKNKWLKLDLNDGSLPDGFAKEFLKSSIEAMKTAYEQEPAEDFSYLTQEQLKQSLPYLSDTHYQLMSSSARIISRQQTAETAKYQDYLMKKALSNSIQEKYPEIFVTHAKSSNSISSQELVLSYLRYLDSEVTDYESMMDKMMNKKDSLESSVTNTKKAAVRQHFGLNRGKLTWMQSRYELENKDLPNEGMIVDALTRFEAGKKAPFNSLTDIQMPADGNSVDAREYFDHLVEHYESGNGTTIGKLFFNSFLSAYRYEAMPKYPNQSTKIASAEAIASKDGTKPATESSVIVNTREDIDVNEAANNESAQCVLISVSIEEMCETPNIDINDLEAVQSCAAEKAEMTEIYNAYCQ